MRPDAVVGFMPERDHSLCLPVSEWKISLPLMLTQDPFSHDESGAMCWI